jgi:hypothetical protein
MHSRSRHLLPTGTLPARAHQLLVELIDNPGALRGEIRLEIGSVNGVSRDQPATRRRGLRRGGHCGRVASPRIAAKGAHGNG